jgi:Xaa-Pro aminopeptidase
MTDRLTTLRQRMRDHRLDALMIVPGSNLRYLTGIGFLTKLRLMAALIPADGPAVLVVPALEEARARQSAGPAMQVLTWPDSDGPLDALGRVAAAAGLAGKRVGVENTVMRVFELRALQAAAEDVEVVDATPLLASMRMVKDADELRAMREAVRVIEATLGETIAEMRAGMTELEVAEIWAAAIKAAGCEPSFDLAVGSGPHGANPHHVNGQRRLQPGDLVVLDGGVYVDGYASDITRTVAVGQPSAEARRIYELVLAANTAGRAACRPGATGEQIDQAARALIEQGGYGAQFIHRTGHGLGIDIHEPPFIVAGSREPLTPGMTITVEPGVYVPGVCGVRIEDDMLITEQGAESLTSFRRDLISV